MKSYAIVLKDNQISQTGFKNLKESSIKVNNSFEINEFQAVVPDETSKLLKEYGIQWNYPWEGVVLDFASGLRKSAYKTRDSKARVACGLSHYKLWKECASGSEPFLILEHDSMFTAKIDFDIMNTKFNILGINNPLGCTRKSNDYYQAILNNPDKYQLVPYIDDRQIPQGLAGNSSYIIKPEGAKALIELVKEYGLWPNDAIMCRQLLPRLGVTKKFYTHIQNLKSTTTL
jgi:GR25 family glycosyltransferase involved in LPS biosynthesis